jgi:hypothetical protein
MHNKNKQKGEFCESVGLFARRCYTLSESVGMPVAMRSVQAAWEL